MIEPKYFTLNTLFADRVFRIPQYQRFYSWRKKQRDDLFNDLDDLYKKGGDRHHFMATIVCYRTGERKPVKSVDYNLFEIVDGQQRITTLILLLKAIQLNMKDDDVTKDIARILVKDDDNLLLLQTNNVNQKLFNKYLREGIAPDKDDIKTHADQNLYSAIREVNEFLARWINQGRDLMELLRVIRNRIGFVIYDTEETHAVYTIFECLNSRGLEVDWLDKMKSVLMGVAFEKSRSGQVADAKINELHNLWAEIYGEMATHPVSGQEILRVTATLFVGGGAGKPLSAEDSVEMFRESCDSAQKTITVSDWLLKVTKKLVKLHQSRYLAPVARILQARVLAVALMLTDSLDDTQKETALDQWERVSFRIFSMFQKDSRTKVGDYVRLAAKVVQKETGASDYSEIMSQLKTLGSDYPVIEAVKALLNEPKYEGFEEECRYILWRYEEHLASEQGGEVNKELREAIWAARSASETIEHIFPQSPEPGGPWKNMLEDVDFEKHIHRLGNLLLLPPGLNSQAGRKGLDQKKMVYRRAEGLRIVSEILEEREWTQKSIEDREEKIAQFMQDAFQDIP